MNRTGRFIISLDYELFWGVFDVSSKADYGQEVAGVHEVLPQIIDLMDRYDVRSTIAVVGALLTMGKDELMATIPDSVMAEVRDGKGIAAYLDQVDTDPETDAYHFDRGVLEQLLEGKRHEIASHTHTHYYCLEPYSGLKTFEDDLDSFAEISKSRDIQAESIIFPRNQMDLSFLKSAYQAGYKVFRGNPEARFHKNGNSSRLNYVERGVRLLDSYFNVSGHLTFSRDLKKTEGLVNVPASLFFRPMHSSSSLLSKMQLNRIKKCMTHAAERGECFHLWWHPHNFGRHQKSMLDCLEELLEHYRDLNVTLGFESATMSDLYHQSLKHE